MLTAKQLEVAETVFDRNKRREAEINDASRQEQAAPSGSGQKHAPPTGAAFGARFKIKEGLAALCLGTADSKG